MRATFLTVGLLAVVVANGGACSSDNDDHTVTGTAGTLGTAGTAGTSATAGTGGTSATAGTTGTAGTTAAGGTAGTAAGGTAGTAAVAFTAVAPCNAATDYTTGASIAIPADATTFVYTPKCLKVAVGATVTIGGSTIHPLSGTAAGSANNPIPMHQTTPQTVTFPTAGFYSFQCDIHFSVGMKGVVWVGP